MQSNTIPLIDDLMRSSLFRTDPRLAQIVDNLVKSAQATPAPPTPAAAPVTAPPTTATATNYQRLAPIIDQLHGTDAVTMGLKKLYQKGPDGQLLPIRSALAQAALDRSTTSTKQFWPDIAIVVMAGLKDDVSLSNILNPIAPLLNQITSPPTLDHRSETAAFYDLQAAQNLLNNAPPAEQQEFRQLLDPQTIKQTLTNIQAAVSNPPPLAPPSAPTPAPPSPRDTKLRENKPIPTSREELVKCITDAIQVAEGEVDKQKPDLTTRNLVNKAKETLLSRTANELQVFYKDLNVPEKFKGGNWERFVELLIKTYIYVVAYNSGKNDVIFKEARFGLNELDSNWPAWDVHFESVKREIVNWANENGFRQISAALARNIYTALKPKIVQAITNAGAQTNQQDFAARIITSLEQPWGINALYATVPGNLSWYAKFKKQDSKVVNTGTAMKVETLLNRVWGTKGLEAEEAAQWLFDQIRSAYQFSQHANNPTGISMVPQKPSVAALSSSASTSASTPTPAPTPPPTPVATPTPPASPAATPSNPAAAPATNQEPSWEEAPQEWFTPEVVSLACALLFKLLLVSNNRGRNVMF